MPESPLALTTGRATLALLAPVSGVIVPLDEVPDPVFAQRLAGDGLSIDPLGSEVVAPCDAVVRQVHRASHVVTLEASGLEIVIHVEKRCSLHVFCLADLWYTLTQEPWDACE